LDRLVMADPTTALAQLQTDLDLLKGRELTRANYFARADVGVVQQRDILERYLLNPQITPTELNAFAGLFPNANYMVSQNLLTRTMTPDHQTLIRRDRDAFKVVDAWLADPRFDRLGPYLKQIQSKLQTFVRQAAAQAPQ